MTNITGAGHIELAGETRPILFDMDAADALFEAVGEHWNLWLIERFVGREYDKGRLVLPPLPPKDLLIAAHAVLAGDRRDRGYVESLQELRKKAKPHELGALQPAITRAVLSSFGVPGEALEVAASVDGASPSDAPAQTHGTGAGTSE